MGNTWCRLLGATKVVTLALAAFGRAASALLDRIFGRPNAVDIDAWWKRPAAALAVSALAVIVGCRNRNGGAVLSWAVAIVSGGVAYREFTRPLTWREGSSSGATLAATARRQPGQEDLRQTKRERQRSRRHKTRTVHDAEEAGPSGHEAEVFASHTSATSSQELAMALHTPERRDIAKTPDASVAATPEKQRLQGQLASVVTTYSGSASQNTSAVSERNESKAFVASQPSAASAPDSQLFDPLLKEKDEGQTRAAQLHAPEAATTRHLDRCKDADLRQSACTDVDLRTLMSCSTAAATADVQYFRDKRLESPRESARSDADKSTDSHDSAAYSHLPAASSQESLAEMPPASSRESLAEQSDKSDACSADSTECAQLIQHGLEESLANDSVAAPVESIEAEVVNSSRSADSTECSQSTHHGLEESLANDAIAAPVSSMEAQVENSSCHSLTAAAPCAHADNPLTQYDNNEEVNVVEASDNDADQVECGLQENREEPSNMESSSSSEAAEEEAAPSPSEPLTPLTPLTPGGRSQRWESFVPSQTSWVPPLPDLPGRPAEVKETCADRQRSCPQLNLARLVLPRMEDLGGHQDSGRAGQGSARAIRRHHSANVRVLSRTRGRSKHEAMKEEMLVAAGLEESLEGAESEIHELSCRLDALLLPPPRGENTLGRPPDSEILEAFKCECQCLVGRLDRLAADALECGCNRDAFGAMDTFDQVTASLERVSSLLGRCNEAEARRAPSGCEYAEWEIATRLLSSSEAEQLRELTEKLQACRSHPACRGSIRELWTLLRFLRAQNGDVQAAAAMYSESLDWRSTFGIDEQHVRWSEEQLAAKSWRSLLISKYRVHECLGKDRFGMPVYIFRWSVFDLAGAERELGTAMILLIILSIHEECVAELNQATNENQTLIPGGLAIWDIGNYGAVPSWWTRMLNLTRFLPKVAKILESNYPELIRKVVIVRCGPATRALVHAMTPLMPTKTFGKLMFCGWRCAEWLPTLREEAPDMDIPPFLASDDTKVLASATPAGGIWSRGAAEAARKEADPSSG